MIDPGRRLRNGRSLLRLCLRKAARAVSDDKGAVLIEAAIVLPVLLMIFLGMVEFSNAFTAKRRVQAVASTTADLVAQAQSVTIANLSDIASIGVQLMQPFSSSGLTLKISSVSEDSQSNITEQWNCFWSGISGTPTCAETGAPYTGAPAGVLKSRRKHHHQQSDLRVYADGRGVPAERGDVYGRILFPAAPCRLGAAAVAAQDALPERVFVAKS